jgi:putative FmdB family regulatory protein
MPTYEYACEACEHQFEEFQSMKDEPLKKCPKCGQLKLRRLLGTGAALLFKGSGFYITDYRSDSYKAAAKAEKGDKGGDKGGGDGAAKSGGESKGGGDAKPAAPSGDSGGSKD